MTAYLELRGVTKVYPNGVVANDGVDLEVRQGEIHALVGENGAGKTTLMKILYGMEEPTAGQVVYKGRPVRLSSPRDALALGIGMVHQHFMLVPSLTVAENIVLGAEPRRGPWFDGAAAVETAERLSREYGLPVPVRQPVHATSVGNRQRVEILKALYRGVELLILDEPTAVLTPQETRELFRALRDLVARGLTIVFITHKLREVMEVSDRVTVMRDGKKIGTRVTREVTREELSRMMVGRDVLFQVRKRPARPGPERLRLEGLTLVDRHRKALVKGVSLAVRAGEILGVAGVEGNGQTELVELVTGLRRPSAGRVFLDGRDVTGRDPRHLRELGLAHIPEDRLARGVAPDASVAENLILDVYYRPPFSRGPAMSGRAVAEYARRLVRAFDVRTPSEAVPVRSLSGGNVQKVVVARELARDPKVLVAAQPTRGIDVGATEFVHAELVRRRDAGTAVLLVSAELTEILALSDRLVVMYGGEVVAHFPDVRAVTEEEVGLYMLGVRRMEPERLARPAGAGTPAGGAAP